MKKFTLLYNIDVSLELVKTTWFREYTYDIDATYPYFLDVEAEEINKINYKDAENEMKIICNNLVSDYKTEHKTLFSFITSKIKQWHNFTLSAVEIINED